MGTGSWVEDTLNHWCVQREMSRPGPRWLTDMQKELCIATVCLQIFVFFLVLVSKGNRTVKLFISVNVVWEQVGQWKLHLFLWFRNVSPLIQECSSSWRWPGWVRTFADCQCRLLFFFVGFFLFLLQTDIRLTVTGFLYCVTSLAKLKLGGRSKQLFFWMFLYSTFLQEFIY